MRVLAVSSAYGGARVGVVCETRMSACGRVVEEHGLAAALPALVARVLTEAGGTIDLVAVIVGPGSFTGLRAGLAIGHGVALGAGIPVVGVTVAGALAEEAGPMQGGRELWTAIEARRRRVFIDIDGLTRGFDTDALPSATRPIAVCGNAANLVAAILAARGADVKLLPFRHAAPEYVAAVALRHIGDGLAAFPVGPSYVDLPEARLPPTGRVVSRAGK